MDNTLDLEHQWDEGNTLLQTGMHIIIHKLLFPYCHNVSYSYQSIMMCEFCIYMTDAMSSNYFLSPCQ